ncbi:MAG TPA: DUF4190 domain-containing protein [Terrimesophilobacter sp.]|nr:DUF4190 domain-containing protein [Terrimesophilobacter sp.]
MTDPESPDQGPVPPPVPPQQPPVPPPASPYQASTQPQPPSPSPYYAAGPQKPPTVLSLLAMIFGIVGVLVSCCYGAGFLFSLAGVILGHLGLKREPARGMALAGVITGYVGLGIALVWAVIGIGLAVFVATAG